MSKFILVILIFLTACVSKMESSKQKWNATQFDLIQLGQSKKDVQTLLGQPSEIQKNDDENWYYMDEKKPAQLGAVSFDKQTEKATGVVYVPTGNDLELNLDYLKNTKFPRSSFEKVPPQRCGRDYLPQEEFYFDVKNGVIIEFSLSYRSVKSYSRILPQKASEMRDRKKDCLKQRSVK